MTQPQQRLRTYLMWLEERGLVYHPDDDPQDIRWSRRLLPEERTRIEKDHHLMALAWDLFEQDRDLYYRYTGLDPEENDE